MVVATVVGAVEIVTGVLVVPAVDPPFVVVGIAGLVDVDGIEVDCIVVGYDIVDGFDCDPFPRVWML